MSADIVGKDPAERKKIRLELGLIGFIIVLVIGLTILGTNVVRLAPNIPISNTIFYFTLVNATAVIMIGLIFLVLRNLYRLFFMAERPILGSKLRTKLIVAFISLSFAPTILLVFTSLLFIAGSQDYWLNANVERSLSQALEVSQFFLDRERERAIKVAREVRAGLERQDLLQDRSGARIRRYLAAAMKIHGFAQAEVLQPDGTLLGRVRAPDLSPEVTAAPEPDVLKSVFRQGQERVGLQASPEGDLLQVVLPLRSGEAKPAGALSLTYRFQMPVSGKLAAIAQGLDGYRDIKVFRDPIKTSHYITMVLVALVIVFAATWFGFRLAGGMTDPILELAKGTERIAGGDYDFTLEVRSQDEIGTLVASFNRMTRDLKASKTELTRANEELRQSLTELDQRRRYMEIVLGNVAAGVVSTDAAGRVATINKSAEGIIKVTADQVMGRDLGEFLPKDLSAAVDTLSRTAQGSGRGFAETQVRTQVGARAATLSLNLSLLRDEQGQNIGLVLVFDDLTELEKAQRMAAWREVARRIAHEIKNPLTPIQLSTQRLRKRYADKMTANDGQVFDECTRMIIRQVEELKRLVDEFSRFARMPAAEPTLNDLAKIVEETLVLYRDRRPGVDIRFVVNPDLPAFALDREQMKRVLINLLENALAAVGGDGQIDIRLDYDPTLSIARLEVADNGPGIKPEDRERLFDPYFSTKRSGTGLGLAIVSTIVADHNGYVRVHDNPPRGTKFTIELPIRT